MVARWLVQIGWQQSEVCVNIQKPTKSNFRDGKTANFLEKYWSLCGVVEIPDNDYLSR